MFVLQQNSYHCFSPDVPQKPVGPIVVTNLTEDSVTLTWKPPKEDGGSKVTGYNIEFRDTKRETWQKAGSVDAETTVWTQSKLLDDSEYVFRVTAVNQQGESAALETDTTIKPQKSACEYCSCI